MIKTIVVVVAVVIAAVLIFAATKPDSFQVVRATNIKAPPEKIFALIDDFTRWGVWSPWEHRDPAMKRTYGATSSGNGAVYAWEGNKEVGQGRMEISNSSKPSEITIKLDFLKPFEAHNTVTFTLESQDDTTKVTWKMEGPAPYVTKIMHVFINMDNMVGKDFETGLANLKAAAEK